MKELGALAQEGEQNMQGPSGEHRKAQEADTWRVKALAAKVLVA